MGLLGRRRVAGGRFTRTKDGHFVRPPTRFRNLVTPDGSPGPVRRRRLSRRSRPLSPLRFARLPLGAPHADLPQAEEARERHLGVDRSSRCYGKTGWEFGTGRGGIAATVNGKSNARRNLSARRSALYRPRQRAGAVGQEAQDHRQQRIVGNHPHAQFGVRRVHQCAHRLLPGRAARRDRPHQRPRLSDVNNGVYRAGFATSQAAYEEAARGMFDALDQIEERLSRQRYLVGQQITEATGGCSPR